MPSGDAQRAWFPEMLEELKEKWSPAMSWDECVNLCKAMTRRRTAIRKKRRITGPRMRCKNCGGVHDMPPPPVGIRSLLFALKRLDLLDDEQFELKDKEWKRHQRKHRLDSEGNPKQNKSREGKRGGC